MKRLIALTLLAITAALVSTGCGTDLKVGGGSKTIQQNATVGQQLIDLQRAKEAGALTDAEFQAQKNKVLAQ